MRPFHKKIVARSTFFSLIAALFIFTACSVAPAFAVEITPVETIAVLTGDEITGKFKSLSGLFYDSIKKRIYLVDSGNKRLVSFDASYKYLAELTDQSIELPVSLVKDSQGFFYLVDAAKGAILYVNVKKKLVEELVIRGNLPQNARIFPSRIAIDSDDRLYIVDKLHRRIAVVNNDGTFIKSFTVNEEGFSGFNDVRVGADGNIYALDTIAGSIYIFDNDGNKIAKFGHRKPDQNGFKFPVSLALDRDGLIYVLDSHAARVLVFNSSGVLQRSFLKKGAKEGELMHPTHISIDDQNRIFIVDETRVQIFREVKK